MHPPNFFDLTSIVSPLEAIENLWENAPTEKNAMFVVPYSDQTKHLKATYRRVQTLRIS